MEDIPQGQESANTANCSRRGTNLLIVLQIIWQINFGSISVDVEPQVFETFLWKCFHHVCVCTHTYMEDRRWLRGLVIYFYRVGLNWGTQTWWLGFLPVEPSWKPISICFHASWKFSIGGTCLYRGMQSDNKRAADMEFSLQVVILCSHLHCLWPSLRSPFAQQIPVSAWPELKFPGRYWSEHSLQGFERPNVPPAGVMVGLCSQPILGMWFLMLVISRKEGRIVWMSVPPPQSMWWGPAPMINILRHGALGGWVMRVISKEWNYCPVEGSTRGYRRPLESEIHPCLRNVNAHAY